MSKPTRIQLRRAKGWRMPSNTVKVDRTTIYGNPFIVGKDGTAPECVYWFVLLLGGYHLCQGGGCMERQDKFAAAVKKLYADKFKPLRGKNLACWCAIGKPCHADVLLTVVNRKRGETLTLKLDDIMAGYGYRMENGKPIRLES